MKQTFGIGGALFTALAFFAGSAQAGLMGTTVTAAYYHPDLSTSIGSQDFLVGPGVELNCGSGGFCGVFDAPPETLDFTDNQIIFNEGPFTNPSNYDGAPYNGFVFTNLNMGSPITGVQITSFGFSGLSAANITFTANSVNLNLSGTPYSATDGFTLTLLTSAVPEPGTSWLMIVAAAIAMCGASALRSRLSIPLRTELETPHRAPK